MKLRPIIAEHADAPMTATEVRESWNYISDDDQISGGAKAKIIEARRAALSRVESS